MSSKKVLADKLADKTVVAGKTAAPTAEVLGVPHIQPAADMS